MRPALLDPRSIALLALLLPGCLMEYVLPGETSTGDDPTTQTTTGANETGTTSDTPTVGGTGDTGQPDDCGDGFVRCGENCVDPSTSEAHCGGCDTPCHTDEMCIASECRDVLVLACDSCPCPDQCPEPEGVLASTTGEGEDGGGDGTGGGDPPLHLCCAVNPEQDPEQDTEMDETPTVLCVIGDVGDPLVCPE